MERHASDPETVDRTGPTRSAWRWLPISAGILFLCLAAHAAWVETPTVDEFGHLPAGFAGLEQGAFHVYGKNPPLLKLGMAAVARLFFDVEVPRAPVAPKGRSGFGPWVYGKEFAEANRADYFRIYFAARMLIVLLGLLTGVLLYRLARDIAGLRSAAVLTALFYLSPNILAHSHVATVDVGCMFTLLCVLTLLRRYGIRPSLLRASATGLLLGVALLVKFTALLFLPVILLFLLLVRIRQPRRLLLESAALGLVALLTINLGMGFQGSFQPLADFEFHSGFCGSLQQALPGSLPVPLPREYLLGFDAQKLDTEAGEFGSYLRGEWSRDGWKSYFLIALAVKTPLGFLLLLLLAPLYWFRRERTLRDTLLVVGPILLLLLVMSFLNRLNVGLRYLLPIFPLLFLFMAPAVSALSGRLTRWVPGLILLGGLISVGWTHPSYLAYFNLAAGGREEGHRWLIASNLDWGQDLYRLGPALDEIGFDGRVKLLYFGHVPPSFYAIDYELAPDQFARGVVAVSVNYLKGWAYLATTPDGLLVRTKPGHMSWLEGVEPVKKAGTIWLYDTRRRQDR